MGIEINFALWTGSLTYACHLIARLTPPCLTEHVQRPSHPNRIKSANPTSMCYSIIPTTGPALTQRTRTLSRLIFHRKLNTGRIGMLDMITMPQSAHRVLHIPNHNSHMPPMPHAHPAMPLPHPAMPHPHPAMPLPHPAMPHPHPAVYYLCPTYRPCKSIKII